jgi:hypothetical protein
VDHLVFFEVMPFRSLHVLLRQGKSTVSFSILGRRGQTGDKPTSKTLFRYFPEVRLRVTPPHF